MSKKEVKTGVEKMYDEAGNCSGFYDHDEQSWVEGTDLSPKPGSQAERDQAEAARLEEEPAEESVEEEESDFEGMTKDQLKAYLDEHEVAYDKDAKKDELVELAESVEE